MSPPVTVQNGLELEPALTAELPIPKPSPVYKEILVDTQKAFKKEQEENGASYPHYLPIWNDVNYPPLQPYDFVDAGSRADPALPNLFPADKNETYKVKELTNSPGAELFATGDGIQLSDAAKDELALFVAKKKVVAFRDQDFADLPIKGSVEFGR
ncbi:hypothetical protein BDZ91DRAFT_798814 [Kalaharituber pfeilii]|nr:hypothetical protein BDZ91DRAFT_798814 [Kalaharituber pfeilii]